MIGNLKKKLILSSEGWFSAQAIWLLFPLQCLDSEARGFVYGSAFHKMHTWDAKKKKETLFTFHLPQQFGVIWDLIYSPVEREAEIKPESFFWVKLFLEYPGEAHTKELWSL